MQDFIIEIINQYGYIGIFLLIAIENIFPPIPSEIILTFGGFLTTFSKMHPLGVVFSSTIGSVTGAIILYFLGLLLGIERLERLFDSKLGKILHFKKSDVRLAEKWFNRHGYKAVFFCRFIPIVRSLISIPAGLAKMKWSAFLVLTILGSAIWNGILIYLGRLAGEAWEKVVYYVDLYKYVVIIGGVVVLLALGAFFIKKRFFEK
ncbi:MAG: DedA family protein [Clostridia bacterium]|nr:DedA family protein [Clostridia bacterium]